MWNMNSGYSGYSMSNRAVDAYEDGEMPLSKWTKKMIISEDGLSSLGSFYVDVQLYKGIIAKVRIELIKK